MFSLDNKSTVPFRVQITFIKNGKPMPTLGDNVFCSENDKNFATNIQPAFANILRYYNAESDEIVLLDKISFNLKIVKIE